MPAYSLCPALQAYIADSARFAPTDSSLLARRQAFACACRHFTPAPPPGVAISDVQLAGRQVRLYRPAGAVPTKGWPALLYLHGGGWNMGSHTTHDWFAFAVMRRVAVAIIAVDYRLAPEHPFPAPLEDAWAVWASMRAGHVAGVDSQRLAVAGDSAGGALAAGLCVWLRQQGKPQPTLQALAYPVLSARTGFPSMAEHAQAPMLTTAGLLASLEGYVPGPVAKADPRALPLESPGFSGLAPAWVGVAEYDPLYDHGRAYVAALQAAGGAAWLHIGKGLVHASLRASGVAEVERFYDELAQGLARAL
ncbi:alpha/beta hydrolase fold domain-containing protein [Pseudomonas sp. NPDC007930]|uniref:alpha/beta hydrolase n=1 Tax=Pseudomonas sp. NPDC007930 TaxID=3364417 RepID=UPI0036E535C3